MRSSPKQEAKIAAGTTTIGDNNTITRCNLKNCAVSGSWLKRCSFEDCFLSQVRTARRTTAAKSHFHNAYAVKVSSISGSTIRDRSSVTRSTVIASNIQDTSNVDRSTVTNSTISKGELWRSTLKDCNVQECKIYRSNFEGLTLKYGVWKRGVLVSRVGKHEPIAIRKDGSVIKFPVQSIKGLPSHENLNTQLQSGEHDDSDRSFDSEDSDTEGDLPPPYKV